MSKYIGDSFYGTHIRPKVVARCHEDDVGMNCQVCACTEIECLETLMECAQRIWYEEGGAGDD